MKIVSFNTNKLNFNGKDKEYCSERFAKVVELLQKSGSGYRHAAGDHE